MEFSHTHYKSNLSKTSICYLQRKTEEHTPEHCDLQQTYFDPLLQRNTEMFLDSSPSVIFQYEWDLQMANEVAMPTDVPVLSREDKDGKKFSN